jgi:hypothetical protein
MNKRSFDWLVSFPNGLNQQSTYRVTELIDQPRTAYFPHDYVLHPGVACNITCRTLFQIVLMVAVRLVQP